jgi:DNA modification methylase
MTSVPTLCLEHMTGGEKRAFAIADNKLALNAGWDEELLAIELVELDELVVDFEIEITGFDTVEIDRLTSPADTRADPADAYPPPAGGPAVTQLGDLFQLGDHRLLCGNALDDASYRRLLGTEKAQMVFTDAPYNVPIDGHVSGNGKTKHRPFVMASGEMSTEEFRAFLAGAMKMLAAHSVDGAIHFHCMDHRHMADIVSAAEPVYGEHKNLCVWNKTNAGLGTFYRSKHELVFVFKVGTGRHINNFGLGERGRYRTNVWDYPGVNTFHIERDDELAMHPTVKPVALIADAIRDCSNRGGIVLDCFGGSGSTLIAAEKTKRTSRLIELDPLYCDTIVRRFERFARKPAQHIETELTFEELSAQRMPRHAA